MARARLIQLEGGRPVAETALGEACVIGREAAADVVVASPAVSRAHVRIRRTGAGYAIADLASLNGTTLNGRPLGAEEHELRAGDQIVVGGAATFVFEEAAPSPTPIRVAMAGAAALALALVAAGAWLALGGDPVVDEAATLAREAVAASRRGDSEAVKTGFQKAAGLLFYEGRLEDVERSNVMEASLELLGGELELDLAPLFRAALDDLRTARPAAAGERCRLDRAGGASPRALERCVRARAYDVLRALRQDPERVPESFYRAVQDQVRHLAQSPRFRGALERGTEHVPMMQRELGAAHMPPILHYLSLIESGYQVDITSTAGARGLWQLMPATARSYGLRVGDGVDERTDPEKSSRVAARYLRDLAFEFGGDALLLAIAAYNKGQNGMRRALKQLDDPFADRSYVRLAESNLLPEETRTYVPRFVAAAVIGEAGLPPASSDD